MNAAAIAVKNAAWPHAAVRVAVQLASWPPCKMSIVPYVAAESTLARPVLKPPKHWIYTGFDLNSPTA